MMSSPEARPCLKELRDEANLPDSLRGPVECRALARLISARVRGVDCGMADGETVCETGRRGCGITGGQIVCSTAASRSSALRRFTSAFLALRTAARRSRRAWRDDMGIGLLAMGICGWRVTRRCGPCEQGGR